jgi:hypothetical protein
MPLTLRLCKPSVPASFAFAAALSLVLTLLSASGAPARTSHRGARASRQHCTLRPRSSRGGSRSRGHRRRTCATESVAGRSRRSGRRASGGALEATPLTTGAGAPYAGEVPSSAGGGSPGESVKPTSKHGELPVETGETVSDPIDPRFLTSDPFGTSSFWIQPWRAYLDTWPASKLIESLGINFNVSRADLEPTAQLLHDSGFKLARIPINWSNLSYEHPTEFPPYALSEITARLSALHNHGLRPLIVLEAYSGAPTPLRHVNLETAAAAPAGSQVVQLAPASAALVVPGKTGFNGLTWRGSPDVLITSMSPSGVATLSTPLPGALPAGPHPGTLLRFAPFQAPKLAGGEPNPEFQATLAGWLSYVGAAAKLAASVVGPEGFDLEVWNELTFESEFLNSENYLTATPYRRPAASSVSLAQSGAEAPGAGGAPASNESEATGEGEASSEPTPGSEAGYGSEASTDQEVEEGPEASGGEAPGAEAPGAEAPAHAATAEKWHKALVTKEVIRTLLRETVAYVRNPANGISPAVGITDGFASQTPFPSGAAAPLGLTALSKHPYVGPIDFPAEYPETHAVPLDAFGARDTVRQSFQPLFIPTYQSLLPEYTLTATSPETLIRDLAPFTTYVYHFPHGRNVGPPGASPVQKWITEYNLAPGKAPVVGPDEATPQTGPAATLSPADKAHFHAKALLRSLTAMVNKGIAREYFFAAAPGSLSLIDSRFFAALEASPGSFPGDQLGGETLDGFRNMLAHFEGPGPSGPARQLKLVSISQHASHAQFAGDGSDAHPNLYDHSVLAVLPFQSSPTHFVIPVYVMTRDLLTLYDPSASPTDISRFDLPDETFRITLGNLPESGAAPSVSAYDPLRNQDTPARLLTREGETATFEIAATDYPRLLSIDYPG